MVSLLVLFFILTIAGSFCCSVWEAVLLSVTDPYIGKLKRDKHRAGFILEDLKKNISRPLTSILTLNTIAHTAGAMGVMAQVVAIAQGQKIWEHTASALMILAVLFLSEIVPKNLGARYWRSWAPAVAFCLVWLNRVLFPIVWVVEKVSPGHSHQASFSRDELKVMADLGKSEGKLDVGESRILKNLLKLRDTTVRDIMTPRVVVFALPSDTTARDYVENHSDSPFSRVLIFEENHDKVTGFVLKDDILLAAAKDDHEVTLKELVRPIASMPEDTSIADAFERLIDERQQLALVHNSEYGGLEGLVTMEDVVETLLGLEIVDEADEKDDMQAFARSMWKRRAKRMGIEIETPVTEKKIEEAQEAQGSEQG